VGNFLSALDQANLVESFDIGGETSMDTENFAFDDSSSAEEIEDFSAVLPGVGVSVFTHALVVESVDLGDLSGLVVTSEESDVAGVLQLQAHQECECLYGVETTVNEIAHKNVAGLGNFSSLVEELDQIMELSMDISTDSNGCAHGLDVALLH